MIAHKAGNSPAGIVDRARSWLDPVNAPTALFDSRGALLFVVLFVFYLFYPHPGFDGLIPDNIAQTAYFSLLSRPDLVGSVGSSSPKGGLILLLGVAHHLSYAVLESAWLFKAMLAFFFAAMLYLVDRIAASIGGSAAGLLAVLVTAAAGYPTLTFYTGSSNLFFLPVVLLGLALLAMGRERAGIVSLCLAVTVRPEAAVAVVLVVVVRCVRRGDWRTTFEYALYLASATLFFAAMAYWTQGAWERIGGGAAAGYPAFESLRTVEHMRQTIGQFFSERFVALLLLPALYTLIRVENARIYLYFYAMVLAFAVLVVIGFFGMHYRYIAAGQVLVFALGCAGLACMHVDFARADRRVSGVPGAAAAAAIAGAALILAFWSTRSVATCATMLAIPAVYALLGALPRSPGVRRLLPIGHATICALVAVMAIVSAFKSWEAFGASLGTTHPAVLDGREFLADPRVPRGASVIAEDELLNYVLVKQPDYLRGARSIQSFNVMPESERQKALSEAHYLYLSKRRNYGWNYLFYFPRATWVTDPFRTAVLQMIRTGRSRHILGAVLNPIYNSDSRFVARIDATQQGAHESQ